MVPRRTASFLVSLATLTTIGLAAPGNANASSPSVAFTRVVAYDTTDSCSVSEQSSITAAITAVNADLTNVDAYFASNLQGARFQQWFGTYDSTRWHTVAANFQAIHAVTSTHDLTFHCVAAANPSTYSFVYPGTPDHIYLGGLFFTAPTQGLDSQAGTLVHEISHFTSVAGTTDHVFGSTAAHALAVSNPGQAVDNADNYEYFSENNPLLQASFTASTPADFGTIERGSQSPAQTVTITSSGPTRLELQSVSVTGDFTVTADTCTGAGLTQTASCTVSLVFAPTTSGLRSGALTVQGNYDVAPPVMTLTGTGTAPAAPAPASGAVSSGSAAPPTPSPTLVVSAPTSVTESTPAPAAPASPADGLTPSQAAALTPSALAVLSPSQLRALSPRAVAALTPQVVRALSPAQLAALARTGSGLHPSQVTKLRATQIRALTPAQVEALGLASLTRWLSRGQRQALARAQRSRATH